MATGGFSSLKSRPRLAAVCESLRQAPEPHRCSMLFVTDLGLAGRCVFCGFVPCSSRQAGRVPTSHPRPLSNRSQSPGTEDPMSPWGNRRGSRCRLPRAATGWGPCRGRDRPPFSPRALNCPDGQGPDRDSHGLRAVTRFVRRVKRKVSRIVSTTGTHKTVTKTGSLEGPSAPDFHSGAGPTGGDGR